MISDRLNLPIDADRLVRQDQILSLSGMTWEDYENLIGARNHSVC